MSTERFNVLDGWRGIAILLVLLAHLFPLGPKWWQLNVSTGIAGMAIFFSLSGFLVTRFLIERPNVIDFLIRRFFRILPLVWLYMIFVLWLHPVTESAWFAHMLFYANYPPKPLIQVTDHLWSLCVEMHFYMSIALLAALFKQRGVLLIPIACILITLLRISDGMHYSVITHFRIDEILIGGVLALIYSDKFLNAVISAKIKEFLSQVNMLAILILFLISCHPDSGWVTYLRPYFAGIMVGATLFNQHATSTVTKVLNSRFLFYVATISFALYIVHPLLASTWLGSGGVVEKYSKRPLLLMAVFALAHLSTFYYEKQWIAFGRRVSGYWMGRKRLQ